MATLVVVAVYLTTFVVVVAYLATFAVANLTTLAGFVANLCHSAAKSDFSSIIWTLNYNAFLQLRSTLSKGANFCRNHCKRRYHLYDANHNSDSSVL